MTSSYLHHRKRHKIFPFDFINVFISDIFGVILYTCLKFRNQARLCLAVFDFEAHIMLNFSRYRTTGMRKI